MNENAALSPDGTDAPNLDKRKRVPPPEPRSLREYFEQEKANPAGFLKFVKSEKVDKFDVADQEGVLSEIESLDPDFQRTLSLVQRAAGQRNQYVQRTAVDFVGTTIRRRLSSIFDFQDQPAMPANRVLEMIVDGMKPLLREKKTAKLGFSIIAASVVWLGETRNLTCSQAADVFSSKLSIILKFYGSAEELDQRNLRFLAGKASNKKSLTDLMRYVRIWQAEAQAGAVQLKKTIVHLNQAKGDVASTLELLWASEEREKKVTEELNQSLAEIERLSAEIRDQKALGGSELVGLKADIQGFLTNMVLPQVSDILDAASEEPPRANVIRDRAGSIQQTLGNKIEWLKSLG